MKIKMKKICKKNLVMTFIYLYICPLFCQKHSPILFFLMENAQKFLRLKLNRQIFSYYFFHRGNFSFSSILIFRNQFLNIQKYA